MRISNQSNQAFNGIHSNPFRDQWSLHTIGLVHCTSHCHQKFWEYPPHHPRPMCHRGSNAFILISRQPSELTRWPELPKCRSDSWLSTIITCKKCFWSTWSYVFMWNYTELYCKLSSVKFCLIFKGQLCKTLQCSSVCWLAWEIFSRSCDARMSRVA